MKNTQKYMAILLGLLVGAGGTAFADTITAKASDDAHILNWDGDGNDGANTLMYLRNDTSGVSYSLVKFDLSGLTPLGAGESYQINAVQLGVWATEYNFQPGQEFVDIGLGRIGTSWDEATVTWNNQPALDAVLGTTTGYNFGAANGGTDIVEGDATPESWLLFNQAYQPDLLTTVEGWANGTIDNNGVALYGTADNTSDAYMLLMTSEHPNVQYGMDPYLYVDYTIIPEPATLGLVGILGAAMLIVRRKFIF